MGTLADVILAAFGVVAVLSFLAFFAALDEPLAPWEEYEFHKSEFF